MRKLRYRLQWNITLHWSEWLSSKNPQTPNTGEGVERRELSCTVGGNVNWYSHYGKQHGGVLKKLKKKLPYDPAIPFLGIYPEKNMTPKDICNPIFTVALFTIAKTWKQPKSPLTGEWIKMWYIYTM